MAHLLRALGDARYCYGVCVAELESLLDDNVPVALCDSQAFESEPLNLAPYQLFPPLIPQLTPCL